MWVQLRDFPGYLVNEDGRVASLYSKGLELKAQKKRGGYMAVRLQQGSQMKDRFVHVLVAEAFLGPKPNGLDVNHRDGDKTNNQLSNLEYVTRSENIQHAYKSGLHPNTRDIIREVGRANAGERNGKSKLSDASAAEVLLMRGTGRSQADVAKEFGVSQKMVSKIWAGHRKTAQNS